MVSVADTAAAPAIAGGAATKQVGGSTAAAGPVTEQESVTEPVKPPLGVTVIVEAPVALGEAMLTEELVRVNDAVTGACPVTDGKTLPAGTYTVRRMSNDNSGPLTLTSEDDGSSVFVSPYLKEGASTEGPQVGFKRVGEQNFLSTIQTTSNIYQIRVSSSTITEAIAKLRNSVPLQGEASRSLDSVTWLQRQPFKRSAGHHLFPAIQAGLVVLGRSDIRRQCVTDTPLLRVQSMKKRLGLERIVGVQNQVDLRRLLVEPFGIWDSRQPARAGFNEPKPRWSSRPLWEDRCGAQDPENVDLRGARRSKGVPGPPG